jgi:PPOX class probable F420-dependent enzyme
MIPPEYLDLLTGAHTATLVTLGPDGGPQTSPVWFLYDPGAGVVRVSNVAGRQKQRNLERDGRVSFTVVDPLNQHRYVELRGIATVADDPECAVRDAVVRKHGYPDGSGFDKPGTQRVAVTITPTRVVEH